MAVGAGSFIIRRGFGKVPEVPVEVPGGTGGGGTYSGGTMIHTEYIDKPLPKIRIKFLDDDETINNKEMVIINLKDFDYL